MRDRADVVVLTAGDLENLVENVVRRTADELRRGPGHDWMSADEAAVMLGVARRNLAAFVKRNGIPCYRPGPKIMTFKRSELEGFLAGRGAGRGDRR